MIRLIRYLAGTLLGIAVALVAMQVLLRFVFNSPQAWAEEVGRYLFVWVVFLGAIVALARDTHIRVTAVIELLGARAERLSRWLNWLITLPAYAFVAYWGYRLAWDNRDVSFYTLPDVSRSFFYLAVPICFTIMVVVLIVLRKEQITPKPSEPEPGISEL